VNPANAGGGPYVPAPLSTSVVGSHARPGWLEVAVAAATRGELGPADVREVLDDAVDMALRDQEDAGIDIVSDGEMRRAGFFTAEFYRHLTGVEALPSDRRLGASGHDQQHRFRVLEPIASPSGLGVVAEFRAARERTERPIKVTIPGPFTLSGRLGSGP
jgi:5-methyltetrahydropteroyltriglutamate--homocysteine methyltransferase